MNKRFKANRLLPIVFLPLLPAFTLRRTFIISMKVEMHMRYKIHLLSNEVTMTSYIKLDCSLENTFKKNTQKQMYQM